MERSFIDTKVRAANEDLRLAHERLDAMEKDEKDAGALDLVRSHMSGAQKSLAEMGLHLDADGPIEPPPNMRECPTCRHSIRAAATLCGFCWSKS